MLVFGLMEGTGYKKGLGVLLLALRTWRALLLGGKPIRFAYEADGGRWFHVKHFSVNCGGRRMFHVKHLSLALFPRL